MNKNYRKVIRSSGGFSLAGVMVAAALMGGLSLAFMRLTKNISVGQDMAQSVADEMDLKTEIKMLLDDEKYCNASFGGYSFKKDEVDDPSKTAEGLELPLYHADENGNRTNVKFDATDDLYKNYGNLEIQSIRLYMPNGGAYPASGSHTDIGELIVRVKKKIHGKTTTDKIIKIPMRVSMQTNASGETIINSCSRATSSSGGGERRYADKCYLTFGHSDSGGAWNKTQVRMNQGGYMAIRMTGDVNGDDHFYLAGTCPGTGNEVDEYLKNCSVDFGWRDKTASFDAVNNAPYKKVTRKFSELTSYKYITTIMGPSSDVNDNDSFYFRIKCPSSGDPEIYSFLTTTCSLCMGQADYHQPSPALTACKGVNTEDDDTWGRLLLTGDVNSDDTLFAGFFCNGEHSSKILSAAGPGTSNYGASTGAGGGGGGGNSPGDGSGKYEWLNK